jgi:hypothetical protein
MSRIHNRNGWTLDVGYEDLPGVLGTGLDIYGNSLQAYAGPPRCLLSVRITREQYSALYTSEAFMAGERGSPSVSYGFGYYGGYDMMWVENIRVTPGEANEIARGTHPMDVLFPVWPELGYRLVAVPVRVT